MLDKKQVDCALSEMFAKTMNLTKSLSPKLNRDFLSILTDYIAPSSLAKTSTTDQLASHFHHSRTIHDTYYSANTFRRNKDGNMIPGPLTVAHQIWSAFGEDLWTHLENMQPTVNKMILTKLQYSHCAKRAYHISSAEISNLQYEAISFAAEK